MNKECPSYRQMRQALFKHTDGQVNISSLAQAFGITTSHLGRMERCEEDAGPLRRLDIWRQLGATEEQLKWLLRQWLKHLPAPARAVVEADPNSARAQDILQGYEIWVVLDDQLTAFTKSHPSGESCFLTLDLQLLHLPPDRMRALGQALVDIANRTEKICADKEKKT